MAETKAEKQARLAFNRRLARKDPILRLMAAKLNEWDGSLQSLSRLSGGVTVPTIRRYKNLETARPSYPTLQFVAKGLGFEFKLEPRKS